MLAASGRPWTLYDTACPSERTDTYYARCPGRRQVPFLATTSQHDAAMAAITAHRADLRAILVDLGSNDLLRSLRTSTAVETEIGLLRNALTRIVTDLHTAAPGVPVVIGNYYNPLANADPATRPQLTTVNAMVAAVATANGARLADFFAAINTTPNATDPHLCDYVDCAHSDIHPTVAGHLRLAQAALAALGPA
jgi:lysophospholipase L1-like esterase